MRPTSRIGFTLFEIGISLLVLSVAMVSFLLIFPVGIKAQQLARFQVYANTKILELVDTFSNGTHLWWDTQTEAEQAAQNTFTNMVPVDLDRNMIAADLGLLPLPDEIARRLDSDNDEISRVLDDGGKIFYVRHNPFAANLETRHQASSLGTSTDLPLEAQSLLFAVVGYAQQNALPAHPCLAWPYRDFYPSPPQPWEYESWQLNNWPAVVEFEALYALFNGDSTPTASDGPTADAYIQRAQALVGALFGGGEVSAMTSGPAPMPPAALPPAPWNAVDQNVFPKPWKVLAARYLACAAMIRTSPAMNPAADADQQDYAKACHESALCWAMRYASSDPYDWGAPRPYNRVTAFDYPLLQHDLFPSAALPVLSATDGTGDSCWRIVCGKPAGQTPANYGQARGRYSWSGERAMRIRPGSVGVPGTTFGGIAENKAQIDGSWGDNAHFNLASTFEASERCRQIVCWAADWRSYEDFESAISGPYGPDVSYKDSRGVQVSAERSVLPPDFGVTWADANHSAHNAYPDYLGAPRPLVETASYKGGWLGLYGADRNGNGVFDRGPLPKSSRMRAITLVRHNFYDRRLIMSLRQ